MGLNIAMTMSTSIIRKILRDIARSEISTF